MIELQISSRARALANGMQVSKRKAYFNDIEVEFDNSHKTRISRLQAARLDWQSIFTLTDYNDTVFLERWTDIIVAAMIACKTQVVTVGTTTFFADFEVEKEEPKEEYKPKFEATNMSAGSLLAIAGLAALTAAGVLLANYFDNN